MTGKGWMQGTETVLGYLPKNTSYNDLIFPVAAEAFGFRGAGSLIICEGLVLLWCLWVAARARDKVGAMLAVGVMAMLFTHVFVNIGMTIHLVPITGIPLPFISYGGTFVVACLAAMGLVQSVWGPPQKLRADMKMALFYPPNLISRREARKRKAYDFRQTTRFSRL